MSSLRLLNQTEITSSVSSVNITDVFSADFDIYCYTNDNSYINANLINSSGSVITDTDYDYAFQNLFSNQSPSTPISSSADNITGFMDSTQNDLSAGVVTWIFNPFNSSYYTFGLSQTISTQNQRAKKAIGVLHQKVSIIGFQLYNTAGDNLDAGTIRTYGLRVDS